MKKERSIDSMKRYMDEIQLNNAKLLQRLELHKTPEKRHLPYESHSYSRKYRSPVPPTATFNEINEYKQTIEQLQAKIQFLQNENSDLLAKLENLEAENEELKGMNPQKITQYALYLEEKYHDLLRSSSLKQGLEGNFFNLEENLKNICDEIKKKEKNTDFLEKKYKGLQNPELLQAKEQENILKNRVRGLFETYFKDDLEFLKGKYLQLKENYKNIEKEKNLLVNKLQDFEIRNQEVHIERAKKAAAGVSHSADTAELYDLIEKLKKDNSNLEQSLKDTQKMNTSLENETKIQKEELNLLKSQLENSEKQKTLEFQDIENLRKNLEADRIQIQNMKKELEEAKKNLQLKEESLLKQIAEVNIDKTVKEEVMENFIKENEKLKQEVNLISNENIKLKGELNDFKKGNKFKEDFELIVLEKEKLNHQLNDISIENAKINENLNQINKERMKLKEELNEIKKENENLNKNISVLSEESSKVYEVKLILIKIFSGPRAVK